MGVLEDLDLENVPQIESLPEGEYELRIVSAEDYVSKKSGKAMIRVLFTVEDKPNSDAIYHYITIPYMDDDERTKNNKLRRIKSFLQAFGLSQQDTYESWVGQTAWALLGTDVDPQTGEVRNNVKRFITGN